MTTDDNLGDLGTSKYSCEICEYTTQCKYKFDRHKTTAKHKRMTDGLQKGDLGTSLQCSCGKTYKFRQGLHKHRKLCSQTVVDHNSSNVVESAVLVELFKDL